MTWAQKNWFIIEIQHLLSERPIEKCWRSSNQATAPLCEKRRTWVDSLRPVICVLAGGEHSYRLVWKRHSGSCKEWNRQERSLSHPNVGEDRLEKGPHTGWGASCMTDYVMWSHWGCNHVFLAQVQGAKSSVHACVCWRCSPSHLLT